MFLLKTGSEFSLGITWLTSIEEVDGYQLCHTEIKSTKVGDYDERRKQPFPACPTFELHRSGREWLDLKEKSPRPETALDF